MDYSSGGQHGGRGVRARVSSIDFSAPDFTQLAETLPEMIPATELPRLLGHIYTAKYLSNLRWIGKGPRCFKLGHKVFYLREDVRAWLAQTVRPFDADAAA